MPAPRLTATGIDKAFPGVRALSQVSLVVHPGEVVAIVGENGAGKSTLMKILAGVYQPDAGELTLNGKAVQFAGPREAMAAGISLIHQELNLAENLTVQDNLFLGREPTWGGPLRFIDRRACRTLGVELLARVGLGRECLARTTSSLAPGQKQLVEIARALGLQAQVLIMDEPTSSLTQPETERL
ncbi:MAG: ATP-binding cassette domain-containing protein, partial [Gemmataceae bacterium]